MIDRKPIEPGIYHDVPFDEYLAWDAMNQSTLKHAARSMAHLRAAMDAPPRAETPSHFTFGTLVHAGLLEPLSLLERYVVMPDFAAGLCRNNGEPYKNPRASNAYKDAVTEFRAAHPGQTAIDAEAYRAMCSALVSIDTNDRAVRYLSDNQAEVSICWRDADTGFLCKARLDGLSRKHRRITDAKTGSDIGDRFAWAIHDFGYDVQSAFYLDGVQATFPDDGAYRFCIVAVESAEPFCVRAAMVSAKTVAVGRGKYKTWLGQYAAAVRTGVWPGYDNPEEWSLPASKLAGEPVRLTRGGKAFTV